MSKKKLKELVEDGDEGLELIKSVSFNELHVSVWYNETCDHFTVQVVDVDVVSEQTVCVNGRDALERVMDILEEAWNG